MYISVSRNNLPQVSKLIPLPKLTPQKRRNGTTSGYFIGVLTAELQSVLYFHGVTLAKDTREVVVYYEGSLSFDVFDCLSNYYTYPTEESLCT